VEVFGKAAQKYPKSARTLAALGAALFAGGRFDEAAASLCKASDLNLSDAAPYIFLGKIEMAAPSPLASVEPKLARFAQEQPENAFANYYYAMAIWKRHESENNSTVMQQVEGLLKKTVAVDPNFGDAYLQLGILYSDRGDLQQALAFYTKAIAVNPQLSTAHYRLGVTYQRMGEPEKARHEFQLHSEIERQQAALTERQRREVKQFMVVLKVQPTSPN
jgi:tetratricopeptide (TPR) repeat protein